MMITLNVFGLPRTVADSIDTARRNTQHDRRAASRRAVCVDCYTCNIPVHRCTGVRGDESPVRGRRPVGVVRAHAVRLGSPARPQRLPDVTVCHRRPPACHL